MSGLHDEIMEIIIDATDQAGVNADWAASKILRLPRFRVETVSGDTEWLRGEIEHCRRMEYTKEAQRFERILERLIQSEAASKGEQP